MKKLLAIVFTILAMSAVSLSFGENTGGDNGKIVGAKGDDPKPLPPEQKPLPPKPNLARACAEARAQTDAGTLKLNKRNTPA
jgi:hypothetical protein